MPDRVAFQAIAIYALEGGETLEIPYSNFISYTKEGGKLKFKTYRVYINPAKLMEKAKK